MNTESERGGARQPGGDRAEAPATSQREAIARIIDPEAWLYQKLPSDMRPPKTALDPSLAKADAILATDGREIVKELVEARDGLAVIEDTDDGPAEEWLAARSRLAAAHAKAKDWLEER